MPGESSKPQSRAEAIRAKHRASTRIAEAVAGKLSPLFATPNIAMAIVAALCFVLTATALSVWARRQPLVAVGRVMVDTRLVRVPIKSEDKEATERAREAARQRTPWVFAADLPVLQELRASLLNLPRTLARVESVDQVEASIKEQFKLTPEALAAIKAEATNGEPSNQWRGTVEEYMDGLRISPLLDAATWQRATQEGLHTEITLAFEEPAADGKPAKVTLQPGVSRRDVLNIGDEAKLRQGLLSIAREAGFSGVLRQLAVDRTVRLGKPTFKFDETGTALAKDAAAADVQTVISESPAGQIIFRRGDVLTDAQLALYRAEMAAFDRDADKWRVWLRDASLAAVITAITLALIAYTALFASGIRRNTRRIIGVCVLLASALGGAVIGTAFKPEMAAATAIVPTIFVAILLCIAYDQRVALAYGVLHGLLVSLALQLSTGEYAIMLLGICSAVLFLHDVRDRASVIRMSLATGVAVAAATGLIGSIERPLTPVSAVWEIAADAALAGVAAVILGGAILFILPSIERLFDITTGMTLIELRDPKHPLLRELQMRAPGTYNHSVTVANIAESAAEAIGANSLLAYVGALYHDIGKMNKPEYFVENQGGGPNKHDKLTPAMSLLVVVGHVKDGVEMARAYALPLSIQHFIESHHGTTLVEYFYHRARKRALDAAESQGLAEDDVHVPDEYEYRYPGPRPQTREAAILMVADAVESAARALDDPTPARLESLVQSIANKRLLDGQFEDCDISLRDLHRITESVSRTLAGIHHSRIDYPEPAQVEPKTATIRTEP
ncbi:MAG TPA: HDIG domain-containing protein [Phycisphaerales bacterium]